jgi:hypothetical protein
MNTTSDIRQKPDGCWNEIVLEKPLEHPHFLKSKLSYGSGEKKKFDFESIIDIPSHISRSNNNPTSTNNWSSFRDRNWGCKWNPTDEKIKQKIKGESLVSEFWTTDVPIGILLKLLLDDPDLKISGHSKTYLKNDDGFVDKNSWIKYEWDILNQYNTDELFDLRYELGRKYDEHGIHDLSLIGKTLKKKEIEEVNTLEDFF